MQVNPVLSPELCIGESLSNHANFRSSAEQAELSKSSLEQATKPVLSPPPKPEQVNSLLSPEVRIGESLSDHAKIRSSAELSSKQAELSKSSVEQNTKPILSPHPKPEHQKMTLAIVDHDVMVLNAALASKHWLLFSSEYFFGHLAH